VEKERVMVLALELLRAYLGLSAGDTTRDIELQGYLDLAQDYISEYLGYPISQSTQTDRREYPRRSVELEFRPIISLTSITIDGVVENIADYRLRLKQGLLQKLDDNKRNTVPITGNFMEVVYESGYVEPYPKWLSDALALTSADIDAKTGGGSVAPASGVKQESIPGVYSIVYDTSNSSSSDSTSTESFSAIPARAKQILDLYRERMYQEP